jgi:hypothetical protein
LVGYTKTVETQQSQELETAAPYPYVKKRVKEDPLAGNKILKGRRVSLEF